MIILKQAEKNYGDFHLSVDFSIPAGRVTGLVGKNGAGKTTMIRLILGLTAPDSGRAEVFGKPAVSLTADDRRVIGAALSEAFFCKELNIRDIAAILHRLYPNFDKAAFLNTCRACRLPEKKPLKEYSTGMRAKLRVLTAMSHGAKLLIMDEPTAGLDVEARNEILQMIRDYIAEDDSRSVLMTSHIAGDLEGLCDDIYLLDEGRILLHEDTDVLLDGYAVLMPSKEQFEGLDRSELLSVEEAPFGYRCLTKARDYYRENYPAVIQEPCGIDNLILLLTGGKHHAGTH